MYQGKLHCILPQSLFRGFANPDKDGVTAIQDHHVAAYQVFLCKSQCLFSLCVKEKVS